MLTKIETVRQCIGHQNVKLKWFSYGIYITHEELDVNKK